MSYADRLAAKLAEKGLPVELPKLTEPVMSVMAVPQPAPISDPNATFWKFRLIEDGADWIASTSPECTLPEARKLWPHAEVEAME